MAKNKSSIGKIIICAASFAVYTVTLLITSDAGYAAALRNENRG